MARNEKIENALLGLDNIIVDLRKLINDGCPSIENLGEDSHINSLKSILENLKKFRHDIQEKYDSDNASIKRREEEQKRKEEEKRAKDNMKSSSKSGKSGN